MKKTFVAIVAFAAVLFGVNANAVLLPDYVAGDIGQISNVASSSPTAYQFRIGINGWFEMGMFGATTTPVSDGMYGTQSISFDGVTLLAHDEVNITQSLSLTGRIGMSFNSETLNGTGSSQSLNYVGGVSTMGPLLGVGLEYKVNREWSAVAMIEDVGSFGTSHAQSVLTTIGVSYHLHN